jgi:hypothetical protein
MVSNALRCVVASVKRRCVRNMSPPIPVMCRGNYRRRGVDPSRRQISPIADFFFQPPHRLLQKRYRVFFALRKICTEAIKTRTSDPRPIEDGTSLEFAKEALAETGICHEQFWPYNSTRGSTVTQATASDPSAAALADAKANTFPNATYISSPVSGGAAMVLAALQRGRAVVISVPVFRDPLFATGPTNWSTPSGWSYGRVLNPPPRSVVIGGHAVCVVGFVPDLDEPEGGYFIFRNSWGTRWGSQAPSAGNSYSPEPGYGEILASYIDTFFWEMLHF